MKIEGAVALVTGGGGMLGVATAERLLKHGARVVIADLELGRAARLVDGAADRVQFLPTDVTREDDVVRAVSLAAETGPLRIVVNCAGTGFVRRTLSRDGAVHDIASFRQMLELNVVGSFAVMAHSALAMTKNDPLDEERGVVINTSSLAGLEGSAGQIAYGTAKAAVAGMTLPAARDLAPIGVRVIAIAPGAMGEPDAVDRNHPANAPLLAGIPHPNRFGTPAEFALLVTMLVEHPYLNGTVIRLDGGARLGLKH